MNLVLFILGSGLIALVGMSRFFFLARWRVGWAMYLCNVVWEFAAKRVHIGRFWLESAAALIGLVLLLFSGTVWGVVVAIGSLLLLIEIVNRRWERTLLTTAYTQLNLAGPAPSANPELIVTLEAPFIERKPRYRLGVLWVGLPFDLEVVVGNHSIVPTQTPVNIRISAPSSWIAVEDVARSLGAISSGSVARSSWTLCPDRCHGVGNFEITLDWGGSSLRIPIEYDGCLLGGDAAIDRAVITRYPGGRRSAFAWRGDMDLYDTSTLQSIEGLESALGLAARYCFPQTMCLSTRLSFDGAAATEWAQHYGVDRGASEIPRFIRWLQERVELRHSCAYPAVSHKPFVLELGNHGHLHYDTSTSAAPGNAWKSHARMGAGSYPWIGSDISSFGEQRDNALEARHWSERLFSFTPRTWAKPGRCNDADTPRAVEAAGCEVLSGSDIGAIDNVLYQPPPHHPGGTETVELTSRYPGDPQHIHHLAMLLFWLHRSQRLGLPMVYMCHQHMRQFEGQACTRFTEFMLRTVLANFNGDFYIDTLFGIGKYWREVLSLKTRRVTVLINGKSIVVENQSDIDLERIPVDLHLAGGAQSTLLFSVKSGESVEIDIARVKSGQEK